jgi:Asp-tRNA(Asn)/Glu-tRNA(Gln) amidotransferase A subunit family amidase
MTRTTDDAAAMMAILAQPDARDGMSLPSAELDWRVAPARAKGLRVGLWLDAGWGLPLDAEVRAVVEACAKALAGEGADIFEVKPFVTRAMMDGLDRFWRTRAACDMAKLPPERRAKVLPFIRDWAAPGASYSGAEVYEGYAQMHAMRDATLRATAAFDLVLSPVAPIIGFSAEAAGPTGDPKTSLDHIGFTVGYNMSEQPAISVNWGYAANGMPIGVQLAARRFADVETLRAAKLIEALRPMQKPWPAGPFP